MTLGDRVAVLRNGILQQVDTPKRLYSRPANLFVAAFMGSPSMNLVHARIEGSRVVFGGYSVPMPPDGPSDWQGEVVLGVRPSAFAEAGAAQLPTLQVEVSLVEELGSEAHIMFNVRADPVTSDDALAAVGEAGEALGTSLLLADEGGIQFTAIVDSSTEVTPGSRVNLSVDPREFHFFDPVTGSSLANRGN
jgi:multiple sugar transport system ATP-binding protein